MGHTILGIVLSLQGLFYFQNSAINELPISNGKFDIKG